MIIHNGRYFLLLFRYKSIRKESDLVKIKDSHLLSELQGPESIARWVLRVPRVGADI